MSEGESGDESGGESGGGGCPMHAGGSGLGGYGGGSGPGNKDPSIYSANDLTYGSYLKVEELMALQMPQSNPAHHDELLFIVIHQAYELWFKLILHELDNAIRYMDEGRVLRAQHFMGRVTAIQKLLVQQIHILQTMIPSEFLHFRDLINPASGFQSLQFREIEFMAGLKDERYLTHFKNRPEMTAKLRERMAQPDLRDTFYKMLKKRGMAMPENASELERKGDEAVKKQILACLKEVYQHPEKNLPLYLLCESLVDFDQELALWREHHVHVVERVIGFKRGTGGSAGVDYLKSTTNKKCFPLLLEVRTHLEKV